MLQLTIKSFYHLMIYYRKDSDMQKLSSGKYKVVISSGSGANRVRKSRTFATKKEAAAWEGKMQLLRRTTRTISYTNVSFCSAFEVFILKYKRPVVSAATYKSYEGTLRMLSRQVPNLKLGNLNHDIMQSLFNRLGKSGLSNRSLLKHKSNISAALGMLVQQGVLLKNYVALVDCRSAAKSSIPKEMGVLSITQYKRLMSYLNQTEVSKLDCWQMLILVMLSTGLRTQEVQALTADCLDMENQTLTVKQAWSRASHSIKEPKTRHSYRTIKVPQSLLNKLVTWDNSHNQIHDDHLLIRNDNGCVPDSASLNYHFRQLQQDVLGMDSSECIAPHGLRRTFASVMLSKDFGNMSVEVVSQILGDTIAVVNEFYRKVMPETSNAEVSTMIDQLNDIA